ncbi:hypothetical protein AWW67_13370 [Roseivirga seohaensis]|uniref:Uncharacterized protein n=1 Tax=Roseivirga seohaensis TaxID=1914963 RepID=A0A150XKU7_9BACT|nr:hypothetical protein [Roseivirga seohaensis]KYG79359.1 hypothetical protein AWW67_13370 [Roseivirga seohaensis]
MKPAKKIATGIAALGLIFTLNAKAQDTANDNRVAFNDASGKSKVEAAKKQVMNSPVIFEGDAGDATLASYDKKMAIHIIGRNEGKMSAEEYAKLLANAFADRKFTDKPMYITVTYEERDEDGKTLASIYMDGLSYKTKEGYNLFTPEQIGGAGAIQAIGNIFVERHGDQNVLKDGVSPTLIVGLN